MLGCVTSILSYFVPTSYFIICYMLIEYANIKLNSYHCAFPSASGQAAARTRQAGAVRMRRPGYCSAGRRRLKGLAVLWGTAGLGALRVKRLWLLQDVGLRILRVSASPSSRARLQIPSWWKRRGETTGPHRADPNSEGLSPKNPFTRTPKGSSATLMTKPKLFKGAALPPNTWIRLSPPRCGHSLSDIKRYEVHFFTSKEAKFIQLFK